MLLVEAPHSDIVMKYRKSLVNGMKTGIRQFCEYAVNHQGGRSIPFFIARNFDLFSQTMTKTQIRFVRLGSLGGQCSSFGVEASFC